SRFHLLRIRRPPLSPLFPYTTLFRSRARPRRRPRGSAKVPEFARDTDLQQGAAPLRDRLVEGRDPEGGRGARRRGVHGLRLPGRDRKSTRLNSSHVKISYAVFCLKKK